MSITGAKIEHFSDHDHCSPTIAEVVHGTVDSTHNTEVLCTAPFKEISTTLDLPNSVRVLLNLKELLASKWSVHTSQPHRFLFVNYHITHGVAWMDWRVNLIAYLQGHDIAEDVYKRKVDMLPIFPSVVKR